MLLLACLTYSIEVGSDADAVLPRDLVVARRSLGFIVVLIVACGVTLRVESSSWRGTGNTGLGMVSTNVPARLIERSICVTIPREMSQAVRDVRAVGLTESICVTTD